MRQRRVNRAAVSAGERPAGFRGQKEKMDFARQRRRTAAGPNGLYYAALAAALFGLVFLAAMAGRAAAQGSSSSSSSSSGTGTATASGSSSSVSGTASAITASGTASASASSSASATRLPSNPATNTSPFPLQLATNQKPNCSSIGSACPAKSPCCRDGYCDSTPYFCGVNCEPLNSFSIRSCFARYPCFSYTDDFDSGKTRVINAADWDGDPLTAEWISIFQPDHAYINNSRLVLKVLKKPTNNAYGRPEGFGASVASSRWIQYGYITASIRTARGGGIVSSFITRGSDGAPQTVEDEIDFEAVGKNLKGVYSNYFSYGDLVYTHGSTTDFTDDTSAGFHTYRIVWLPDYIQWVVDNRILRTVYKNQTWDEGCKCYKYPMREARVAFSVWDGGQGAEGTAWWAGGPTDWSKDPNDNYMMEVDWVDIGCFYKGNVSQVFTGKNSSLLSSATGTVSGTATTSKVWTMRPQATYVNGGQLGPGMNGTNGTLTLIIPGAAGGRVGGGWSWVVGVVAVGLAFVGNVLLAGAL